MTGIVYGFVGAMFALVLFAAGFLTGYRSGLAQRAPEPERMSAADRPLTEEEKKERDRLIAEQNAFRVMMSYNSEMAYSNNPEGEQQNEVTS